MDSSKEAPIHGKTVVITGATSGIGRLAAEKLARLGARLVLVARDPRRADDTLARLREIGPGQSHCAHIADLSRLAEMKRVGAEIAAAEPRVDVLVNNAGAIFSRLTLTEDGLERTFAVNHMAYFVLTAFLRDRLIAAAPARIVNTASDAHHGKTLDLADLQSAQGFRSVAVYGRTKLANILFTRELACRLAGTGVTANALHPGFVRTGFGRSSGGAMEYLFRVSMLFGGSPEPGADTIVYLARAPDMAGVTGGYFYKSRPAVPSPQAQDDNAARRLWEETAKIAGMTG
jgi:NAD(P)-dependent dehydrogenase (short-subunit alcohol dehydrogenase family)